MVTSSVDEVFDDIVLCDNLGVEQGYQEGLEAGEQAARITGSCMGYQRGAEMASEVAFYLGFVTLLQNRIPHLQGSNPADQQDPYTNRSDPDPAVEQGPCCGRSAPYPAVQQGPCCVRSDPDSAGKQSPRRDRQGPFPSARVAQLVAGQLQLLRRFPEVNPGSDGEEAALLVRVRAGFRRLCAVLRVSPVHQPGPSHATVSF